jgi:Transglutaminase-like superfamily
MKPPAPPEDALATRLVRSAWRSLRGAIRSKNATTLEHAHHGAVWLVVKVAKLDHAKAVARAGARFLPELDADRARELFADLRPVGTCLSRALTIASRLRDAEVAFGFDPARAPNFRPHAWVLHGGRELIAGDACATTLTTIRLGP